MSFDLHFLPMAMRWNFPPGGGKVKIAENQTLQLGEDVVLKIPLSKNDPVLQVLASSTLQAAGWKQFSRQTKYGHGSHTLKINRKIVAPAPTTPGTGTPSSGKPRKITVQEFELAYAITYRGQAVVQGTQQPTLPAMSKKIMQPAPAVKKKK